MPANKLKDNFMSALRKCELQFPWSLLKKQEPYDDNKYRYSLRKNTQPATVKLYYPILKAIWLYLHPEEHSTDRPYRMVQKHVRGSSGLEIQYVVEMGLQDNSSLVVTATEKSVRISHCETDGTREAILPFQNESADTLTAITLALLPLVLDVDAKSGDGKMAKAMSDIGGISGVNDWKNANDIPDIFKEAFYFTDAMNEILTHSMDFEFGPATSSSAAEVEDTYFNSPTGLTGALVEELYWVGGWEPQYVKADGSAARSTAKKKDMTIGEAKAQYSSYNADRKWNLMEQMLIPYFPDDTPVMPEVIRIADRICNTQNDPNPVVNIMWRGITSYGKSTGIKQLAAIMNTPLLIMTCHPGMEITEFKSTFVPAGSTEGVELDMSGVVAAKSANDPSKVNLPFFEDALAYVSALPQDKKDALMEASAFFMTAMMDVEMACEMLLGKIEAVSTEDLCALYCAVREELATAPLHKKITSLEAAGNTEKEEKKPEFMHVVSNYVKAMVNGYFVEIQEASRIRDSGVLVGLNEFDRAGAVIPLMNGAMARRHKKAICIISDNVGYASCRPIDPSVLRRQGMIIDSYELTREQLLDRVKRNTGCTDDTILDTGYDLWNCVKDYCAQNSIVEGSVSATELERFVQAVYYDGLDSIPDNLNDCIISKATSSIEDQREIRAACSAIYGVVAA